MGPRLRRLMPAGALLLCLGVPCWVAWRDADVGPDVPVTTTFTEAEPDVTARWRRMAASGGPQGKPHSSPAGDAPTPSPPALAPDILVPASSVPPRPATTQPPTVEILRAEVERNPHAPAPSLIAYAADGYDRLQAALASPPAARRWMDEVDAAMGAHEPLPEVVQATLLEQARQLAAVHPGVADDCERLWQRAPERVRDLVD